MQSQLSPHQSGVNTQIGEDLTINQPHQVAMGDSGGDSGGDAAPNKLTIAMSSPPSHFKVNYIRLENLKLPKALPLV